MASKIILKKSSVAAKAPVAGDLDFGELAINYTDSKLYFKKADGSIDAFTSAAASAPVTSVGGNIGDVTDAQLLTSIKNVDGSGSGLDADFLDGLHASSFYLASNPNGYTSNTGTVTSVGATAPLVSSGGTAPSISIPAANSTTNGYMSSAYASKLDGIAAGATANTGTVSSVSGTGSVSGLTLSGTVTTSGNLTLGGTLSLTSGQVTTALGYTPYNSTNPSGYITSSASITGSSGSVSGLTLTSSANGINPDTVTQNQLGYNTSVSLFGQTDGGLYSSAYNSSWIHQIYGDFRTGQIAIRGKNSGTWQSWRTVLDSSNYNTYSPTLTGGGASGTWGINITGNAATASNGGVTSVNGQTGAVTVATGASLSAANTWTAANQFTGNGNTASASGIGIQAYSTSSNGAIMAFHRAGVYAINMGLDSDNVLRIGGWSAGANRFQMDMSGNLTMAGNVTAFSDENLKKDWKQLQSSFVEELSNVRSGTYTRIDSEERQAGCSAQDWQKLLPEVVSQSNDGVLSLAYGNAALVSSVELAKRIVEQDKRIAELERLVSKLIGD